MGGIFFKSNLKLVKNLEVGTHSFDENDPTRS